MSRFGLVCFNCFWTLLILMSNVLREPDYLPENKVNNRITHICTGTSVGCLDTMTIIITIIALFYIFFVMYIYGKLVECT